MIAPPLPTNAIVEGSGTGSRTTATPTATFCPSTPVMTMAFPLESNGIDFMKGSNGTTVKDKLKCDDASIEAPRMEKRSLSGSRLTRYSTEAIGGPVVGRSVAGSTNWNVRFTIAPRGENAVED